MEYAELNYEDGDLTQFLTGLAEAINDGGGLGAIQFSTADGGIKVEMTITTQAPRGFPL